jgi:hypothetical protein
MLRNVVITVIFADFVSLIAEAATNRTHHPEPVPPSDNRFPKKLS